MNTTIKHKHKLNYWTESEISKAKELAEKIVSKDLTYYKASKRLQSCTNRSFEACRTRLKILVKYINSKNNKDN